MSPSLPSQLLFRLKTCVEHGLNQKSSFFNGSSLKNRLRNCLVEILHHGLMIQRNTSLNDLFLSSPLLNHLVSVYQKFHPENAAKDVVENVESWVTLCILEQALADHFKLFLADKSQLQAIYTDDAFLLSGSYADALVLCLQALELSRPEFLAEIDPILFLCHSSGVSGRQASLSTPVLSESLPSHFRRSAFSVVSLGKTEKFPTISDVAEQKTEKETMTDFPTTSSHTCFNFKSCPCCIEELMAEMLEKICIEEIQSQEKRNSNKGHRRAFSDIVLDKSAQKENFTGQQEFHQPIKKHKKGKGAGLKRGETLRINTGGRGLAETHDFDWLKKSLENTQQSLVDARLRDLEISIELERENTHFYLSEMLIAAVEQMKWRQVTSEMGFGGPFHLQQPIGAVDIPISRTLEAGHRAYSSTSGLGQTSSLIGSSFDVRSETGDSEYPFSEVSLSELTERKVPSSLELESELNRKTYTPTASTSTFYAEESRSTARSATPISSYQISPPPIGFRGSYESVENVEERTRELEPAILLAGNIARENRPTLEDKERAESNTSSAEVVAASLLRHFSKKIRPTAAEMDWLVSFSDAPQLILPLPTSSPVMPDEFYATDGQKEWKVRIRGTHDWAPPRPQVIFSLHPPPKLKRLLEFQQYRCAGCGLKLEKSVYQKRLRYCEYLGKFFCQVCHRGSQTQIPARILHRWDFSLFPVSDFGQRFLSEHANKPMFNVRVINKRLYEQVKAMRTVREKRTQVRQMWDFIRTCRVAGSVVTKQGKLKDLFLSLPMHFLEEDDMFALGDFTRVKDGTLERAMDTVIFMGKTHIEGCQHCTAQGFLCELCKQTDVLFPYQTDSVYQCKLCGSCNHLKCCKKNKFVCPKCTRIKERQYAADISCFVVEVQRFWHFTTFRRNEQALAALARATALDVPAIERGDRDTNSDRDTVIDYSASVVLS